MELDLNKIRRSIDGTDDRLSELFLERMNLCGEVAKYKKQTSKAVRDDSREKAIISRLTDGKNDIDASSIALLYNTIFEISRARQSAFLASELSATDDMASKINKAFSNSCTFPDTPVVACHGVEGAYSQIACDTLFRNASKMYFDNFESVFKSVESGLCKYGVLPFENSSYGSVGEVYDLFSKTDVRVIRSIKLPIHHTLLAKKGAKLSDIKEVFSHEQAVGQCSEFLAANKDIKVNICENTSVAARMVSESERSDIAAISSLNCAELYSLDIIKTNLQNSGINYTMFYCISKELEIYDGAEKAAFMFTIPNRSGSLFNILARFAIIGVNLTKIESRPICGKDFLFIFYAEAETNGLNDKLTELFAEFEKNLEFFRLIGFYKEITID